MVKYYCGVVGLGVVWLGLLWLGVVWCGCRTDTKTKTKKNNNHAANIKIKSAENRLNTGFSALIIFIKIFTSDNKHYVNFTDFIFIKINTIKLALLAIMITYLL